MATNVDKALYQAPVGIEQIPAEEITVEIIPDEVELEDSPVEEAADAVPFDANLVEVLEAGALSALIGDLRYEIDNDINARGDWEKVYVKGLKLLGLKPQDVTEPWDGACSAVHPMITEAIVRFQSEAVMETFPAAGPVRTRIIGKETPEKKDAARRVETDMNFQLTEVMQEFRPEHERMLWTLPGAGSAFKKVYYDPTMGRQVSMFIPPEDVILPYGMTDISTSPRVTHRMRKTKNDIEKLIKAKFYAEAELGDPVKSITDDVRNRKDRETGLSDLNYEHYELYEAHVDLIVEDDPLGEEGIALPYVLTFDKATDKPLALYRNWKEDDPLKLKRQHFVHYQYVPGFGAYGFGLFHLIGGYAESATSILRQLVDAGTLSNLPGGMKTKGLRIKGDDTPIAPGEFRDVDIASGTLRDNVMPLPYKEPSNVLAQLLDKIIEEGRRFSAAADLKISDMSANAPVGTTLALLERALKVMSAVQARIHFSLKQELKLLAGIIRDFTDEDYAYDNETDMPRARKEDFKHTDIIPVSDPNAATMSQRVVQYQAVIQLAQMAPDIYDLPVLHREMLEVLGIKNAAKILPLPDDMKPVDPISENMALLKGKPVKAFMYQNHQAHLTVHMAMLQDPQIAQMMGQSPAAAKMAASVQAHIAEHLGYAYRARVEQVLGAPLPPPDEPMPPEAEVMLSQLTAQAATQVLQQAQAQQAQQLAQQQAQDPVLQLQAKEVEIKAEDVERKKKKDIMDAAARADELAIRREEVTGRQEHEGMSLGVEIARAKEEMQLAAEAAAKPAGEKQ